MNKRIIQSNNRIPCRSEKEHPPVPANIDLSNREKAWSTVMKSVHSGPSSHGVQSQFYHLRAGSCWEKSLDHRVPQFPRVLLSNGHGESVCPIGCYEDVDESLFTKRSEQGLAHMFSAK